MSMSEPTKDVSMVDVSIASNVKDEPPARRKSTLILSDEQDFDSMNVDKKDPENGMVVDKPPTEGVEKLNISGDSQQQQPAQAQPQASTPTPDPSINIPVDIKWVQGGLKVYVTGSFTGWRKMIGLAKQPDNTFQITLGLPVGTHRFRFVVDNELRFSDFLPTATDQMGNFVNYAEVSPEQVEAHLQKQHEKDLQKQEQAEKKARHRRVDSGLTQEQQQYQQQQSQPQGRSRASSISKSRSDSIWGLTNDDDDMGNGYSRYHDEEGEGNPLFKKFQYINDIPPIFTDPKVMEQYYMAIDKQSKQQNGQQQAWLHPPQLPPHLENVILNNFNSQDKDNNSGALPIPNHVVLNHLATTSIKHNTLAVASVVRYKRKYVTQVLYAPLQQAPPPATSQEQAQA